MSKMGDAGPVTVEFRDEDTETLLVSQSMSQIPQIDWQVKWVSGAVYKVERVGIEFYDASSGQVDRTTYKVHVFVSAL